MRILLVGHGCSPRQGSEPGATWNWAWSLSCHHDVWALAHPHDRVAVESFLAQNPNPRLRFVWVKPPEWIDPWDPGNGQRRIRLHYPLWQRMVLRKAAQLHRLFSFDVAHHVSWGSVSAPPLLWRLPIPLVWGPVGGGQKAPEAFRQYFGSAWRTERLRGIRLALTRRRPALKNAARKSALVLATNHETRALLCGAGCTEVKFFLDTGVPPNFLLPAPPVRCTAEHLELLWVGRLEHLKALPLALEALARLKDVPWRLAVVGDGSQRGAWERLSTSLGLSRRVRFLGRIPWLNMPHLYRGADSFIFTSLRDSFGGQVLEAMANGLPIVTLNHQGVGAFVPDEAGIKVAVTSPEETVAQLAEAIRLLHLCPELRLRMGMKAWESAQTQTWERRAAQMSEWYEGIVRVSRHTVHQHGASGVMVGH